ncbi:MAG TPA: cytochrome P450 [Jatrophihabitans sp.]
MTSTVERPSLENEVTWFLTPGHPSRAAITEDPFPFYERLRDTDPVHESAAGPWLVTSYDGVRSLVDDPDWSRDARAARLRSGQVVDRPAYSLIESGMLWRDPPDHTRLRRLVHKAFTPKALQTWHARIDDIVTELLDDVGERSSFDFLHDLAFKLPAAVICQMIGMPPERYDDYVGWAAAAIEVQEPGDPQRESLSHADQAARDALAYFGELIDQKRRQPGDDILSMMIEADHAESTRVTDEEIVGMCLLLHVAGYETTSYLMTNGMYHLIRNPDQYSLLRDNPDLVPAAVMEMLRYDGPARATMIRWAAHDMPVGDKVIPEGASVLGIFGAAHRDPAHFDRPDVFDITRDETLQFGFGHGVHYCLGVNLAKMEAGAMFQQLVTRLPRLEIATDELRWKDSLVTRALLSLPVAWTGGRP